MYECPAQASPVRDAKETTHTSDPRKRKFDKQTFNMVLFAFLESLFLTGFFGGYPLIMPNFQRQGFFNLCQFIPHDNRVNAHNRSFSPSDVAEELTTLSFTQNTDTGFEIWTNGETGQLFAVTGRYSEHLELDSKENEEDSGKDKMAKSDDNELKERKSEHYALSQNVPESLSYHSDSSTLNNLIENDTYNTNNSYDIYKRTEQGNVEDTEEGTEEGTEEDDFCSSSQQQLLHWVGHATQLLAGFALVLIGVIFDKTGTFKLRLLTM